MRHRARIRRWGYRELDGAFPLSANSLTSMSLTALELFIVVEQAENPLKARGFAECLGLAKTVEPRSSGASACQQSCTGPEGHDPGGDEVVPSPQAGSLWPLLQGVDCASLEAPELSYKLFPTVVAGLSRGPSCVLA